MSDLSPAEADAIIDTTRIFNWISIGTSLYVILTYALFKWRFPSSLALYFAFASFCLPWFVQIGVDFIGLEHLYESPTLCKIQAIGIQFFANCIVWWWLCIGINIYMIVVKEVSDPEKFMVGYHLLGWGMPTLCTLIPLFFQKYGPIKATLWCWIDKSDNHVWQFLFLYGAMGISSIIGLVMWIYVFYAAWRLYRGNSGNNIFLQPHMVRHIAFVLSFMIVFAVLFSNRVQNMYSPNAQFGWMLVSTIVVSSQGLISFICFGLSKGNLESWWQLFRRCYYFLICKNYEDPVNSHLWSQTLPDTSDHDSGEDTIGHY